MPFLHEGTGFAEPKTLCHRLRDYIDVKLSILFPQFRVSRHARRKIFLASTPVRISIQMYYENQVFWSKIVFLKKWGL